MDDPDTSVKVKLFLMKMEDLAYDDGGAYWGMDDHRIGFMYIAQGDDVLAFVRAKNRELAKMEILGKIP